QWQLCNAKGEACSNISEAVGASLKLTSSMIGSTLRVVVTATNSGGSQSATSNATSVIKALLPSNTALPSISGVLQDGQLLSASNGTWTGSEPITYAYQWQLCNAKGEASTYINIAEGASPKLTRSTTGLALPVVVAATNTGGSQSAPANATSAIKALLPSNTD